MKKRHGRLRNRGLKRTMHPRRLHALLILLLGTFLCGRIQAAVLRVPYFVILPDDTQITDFSDRLEHLGAVIKQQMPPNILTFEADGAFNIQNAGPVKRLYRGFVPLADLSTYGPLAEAAGIQWNRQIVEAGSQSGFRTAGAMRAQAAQNSLPSPLRLTASLNGSEVHALWDAVSGAVSYTVQLSKTADFTDKLESITMRPGIDLPRLDMPNNGTLYVRVRAVDGEVAGAWSAPVSLAAGSFSTVSSNSAPLVTSPLDNSSSDGFLVVLEWVADTHAHYRVQLAEADSFEIPLVDEVVAEGALTLPSAALKMGKTYFWRTRLWTSIASPWSAARRFTVGEPHNQHDAMVNPEAPR